MYVIKNTQWNQEIMQILILKLERFCMYIYLVGYTGYVNLQQIGYVEN